MPAALPVVTMLSAVLLMHEPYLCMPILCIYIYISLCQIMSVYIYVYFFIDFLSFISSTLRFPQVRAHSWQVGLHFGPYPSSHISHPACYPHLPTNDHIFFLVAGHCHPTWPHGQLASRGRHARKKTLSSITIVTFSLFISQDANFCVQPLVAGHYYSEALYDRTADFDNISFLEAQPDEALQKETAELLFQIA